MWQGCPAYPFIQVAVFHPSTSKVKDVIVNIVSSPRALYVISSGKRPLRSKDVRREQSNMKVSKIMKARDGSNDGSINFP